MKYPGSISYFSPPAAASPLFVLCAGKTVPVLVPGVGVSLGAVTELLNN